MDEVFVAMKNGTEHLARGKKSSYKLAFLWNVMDRKTRFLLASRLSRYRDSDGCMRAINEARLNAQGNTPENLFADNWRAYKEGIPVMLPNTKLIANSGIAKPHRNNNRIERLNGTCRERIKVQRGWKSMDSKIPEGFRIHYNFVKPHMALEGQTPAQRAGIGIDGKNKWFELLKQAQLN